jgi:hypothetical protein
MLNNMLLKYGPIGVCEVNWLIKILSYMFGWTIMGLRTAKRKFSASNVKQIDRLSGDLIMDWASIIYSDHIKLSNDFQ